MYGCSIFDSTYTKWELFIFFHYFKLFFSQLNTYNVSRKKSKISAENGIAIALAGQKSDLEGRREVSQEEAETWARQNDLPFLETSAKNDFNVEKIFSKLAVDIYKRLHDGRLVSDFVLSAQFFRIVYWYILGRLV